MHLCWRVLKSQSRHNFILEDHTCWLSSLGLMGFPARQCDMYYTSLIPQTWTQYSNWRKISMMMLLNGSSPITRPATVECTVGRMAPYTYLWHSTCLAASAAAHGGYLTLDGCYNATGLCNTTSPLTTTTNNTKQFILYLILTPWLYSGDSIKNKSMSQLPLVSIHS